MTREQREQEFLRLTRQVFKSVSFVEAMDEASTLFSVEFADGAEHQVCLHFDEYEEDESEDE